MTRKLIRSPFSHQVCRKKTHHADHAHLPGGISRVEGEDLPNNAIKPAPKAKQNNTQVTRCQEQVW